MKKTLFALLLVVTFTTTAFAVPTLQLWFNPALNSGAAYDSTDEGWETGQNPAVLSALIHNKTGNTDIEMTDTFRLLISLPEILSTDNPNGNYSVNVADSASYSASSFTGPGAWNYGNPGVSPHGVYDAWYTYFDFTIDASNDFAVVDVEPPASNPVDGWRADFSLTFAGDPTTLFHFDLVDFTTGTGNNNNYVNINPFSHDAQSGNGGDDGVIPPQAVVPEPTTILLLGAGLVGLGLYGRKRKS